MIQLHAHLHARMHTTDQVHKHTHKHTHEHYNSFFNQTKKTLAQSESISNYSWLLAIKTIAGLGRSFVWELRITLRSAKEIVRFSNSISTQSWFITLQQEQLFSLNETVM